jgi:hypothetical protein
MSKSSLQHPSTTKLNAAGLSPDVSMNLAERQPEADEMQIMQAIQEVSRSVPWSCYYYCHITNIVSFCSIIPPDVLFIIIGPTYLHLLTSSRLHNV